MGLAYRVIPTILCRGNVQVKGARFNSWRTVGVVEQSVRIHQARGVDELVLLDIGATPEGRGPDLALIERLTADCFMPIAVGGGVRTVQDVRDLLRAGADKVVIGAASVEDPGLVRSASDIVGSQAIVVAIDSNLGAMVVRAWDDGGRLVIDTTTTEAAAKFEHRGAGEILITAVDREGTMQGYDLELVRQVSAAVNIPVIAHGGCRDYEDMRQAIEAGASAVAAGALFQFTDATPKGAARYLQSRGIEARV